MVFLDIQNMMTEWDLLKKNMTKNLFVERFLIIMVAIEEEGEVFIKLLEGLEEGIIIIGEVFKIIEVPEDHMGE